jgi:hypothetical protein
MNDQTFLSDLKRAKLDLNPLSGEALQAAIAGMGNVPDSLVQQARRVSDMTAN